MKKCIFATKKMASSEHTSKMKILCIMGVLFSLMLGLLLGISLNINSHDVLTSYRSSITTINHSNTQLAKIMQAELDAVLQDPDTDTLTLNKVEILRDEQIGFLRYWDTLHSNFLQYINGSGDDVVIKYPDNVDATTYFMVSQGNATTLRRQIEAYQQNILQLVDDTILREQLRVDIDFHTQDKYPCNEFHGWECHHFEHTMAIEAENQLNLIQQQALMSGIMVLNAIKRNK